MQKRYWTWLLILTALFLAGCGSRDTAVPKEPYTLEIPTTEAVAEGETAGSDVTGTAAATETFQDPVYNGLVKELVVPCEYDLDGDGTVETINYQVTSPEGNHFDLKIGEAEIAGSGDQMTGRIYAMSIDGETVQLLLEDLGGTAGTYSHMYVYRQGDLAPAGMLTGEISALRVDPERQQVTAVGSSQIFQSYNLEKDFTLEDGVLTEVPRAFYAMGNEVTLRKSISLQGSSGNYSYTMTLEEGSRLIVLGTDNRQWVCLQDTETGAEGWLEVPEGEFGQILVDGESVSAQDYFDGLYYFG